MRMCCCSLPYTNPNACKNCQNGRENKDLFNRYDIIKGHCLHLEDNKLKDYDDFIKWFTNVKIK